MSEVSAKRLISVVTHCYNEGENVFEVAERIREVFAKLPSYEYEHLFIDNCSTDGTKDALRRLAGGDPKNQGHLQQPQRRRRALGLPRVSAGAGRRRHPTRV
ncbi:MAG: glycosyltransferase [Myxococcales bacterium]